MQYTYSNLIEMVGVDTTYTMLQKWDKINIYISSIQGNYAASTDRKERRNMRKWALVKKQDAFQHLEADHYQLQALYEIGNQGASARNGQGKGRGGP